MRALRLLSACRRGAMTELLGVPLLLLGIVGHEVREKLLADFNRGRIELGARRGHEIEIALVLSAHEQRWQPQLE